MDIEKKKRIIIISVISFIILVLLIFSIYLVTVLITKNNLKSNVEDLYNKDLYVSTVLPNIDGNENVIKDEFGRKNNISQDAISDKKWMNLDFIDFEVYSSNSTTSVISFKIINNNNMIIESGTFQLLLKDNAGNIVSLVDFDEVTLPSTGVINVTIDITGDIANVKEIVVDEINYKMQLQEVK